MIILGIETSCDETAVALVEDGVKLLSSAVASSLSFHAKTGGIVPEVAARKQLESVLPVLDEALAEYSQTEIDAIAVTKGPGLIGSLLVGVSTAKALSYVWQKPLIPINHLLAHLYANYLGGEKIDFPALGLIVSGGHTELIVLRNHGDCEWVGGTRDDAAGEAFDKVARVLGLADYPGGPAIQVSAETGNPSAITFPRPMINSGDFDFSFSGLKTAVINYVRTNPSIVVEDVAASFQEAVSEVLVKKALDAAREYQAKSILLAGGVAANQRLREMLRKSAGNDFEVFVPPLDLCMDDAAYIASCAYFNNNPVLWGEVKADPNLRL